MIILLQLDMLKEIIINRGFELALVFSIFKKSWATKQDDPLGVQFNSQKIHVWNFEFELER